VAARQSAANAGTLSGSARSPIVEVTIEPLVRVVLLKDLSRAGDVTAMFSDPE
jgi:hypothetical protein